MRFSTIDYPGTLCCVLFVRGCNLSCFYCHNRGLLTTAPAPSDPDWDTTWAFLKKRAGMLDGVVVSGGEPTLHEALPVLLQELKALGYKVKLDTNGWRPETIGALVKAKLVDYVAVDWKAPLGQFQEVCGAAPAFREEARRTVLLLLELGADFEVRTTLYPDLTGHQLLDLAAALPPVPRYRINYYKKPEQYLPQHEQWVAGRALTPEEVKLLRAGLVAAQPGMVLG